MWHGYINKLKKRQQTKFSTVVKVEEFSKDKRLCLWFFLLLKEVIMLEGKIVREGSVCEVINKHNLKLSNPKRKRGKRMKKRDEGLWGFLES